MKKSILALSITVCCIISGGYAQENSGDLEKEVSKINSQVEGLKSQIDANTKKLDQQLAHIQKQDKKIASYERALSLLETKYEVKLNDIVLNIKEVIGNRADGTLTFNGVLVNEGSETARISSVQTEYFDNEANNVRASNNIKLGQSNNIEALVNVPAKFTVVFKNIPSTKAAKVTALKLKIMERHTKSADVIFKNMDIEWED